MSFYNSSIILSKYLPKSSRNITDFFFHSWSPCEISQMTSFPSGNCGGDAYSRGGTDDPPLESRPIAGSRTRNSNRRGNFGLMTSLPERRLCLSEDYVSWTTELKSALQGFQLDTSTPPFHVSLNDTTISYNILRNLLTGLELTRNRRPS